jgi:glyoxylase-like metal-dependent hydrolase (beta-lactamase superfamily II)
MEQIAENVYVETSYEGINVGAIVTNQGIIAIDAPSYPRQARDWAMRLHSVTHRPVLYLILTDYQGDRILNTRWFNAPVITHQITSDKIASYDKRYPTHLFENLAARNPLRSRELNSGPVDKPAFCFSHNLQLCIGNNPVHLVAAAGPTSGNIWVYLPTKEVLFAGDSVTTTGHPFLSESISTSWLANLQRLREWPNPIKTIVPGRGKLTNREGTEPISSYLQQMQTVMRSHIAEGKPREGTAVYVPEFMGQFPLNGLPPEWLRQQIKHSLDHVYDEIQLGQNGGLKPSSAK